MFVSRGAVTIGVVAVLLAACAPAPAVTTPGNQSSAPPASIAVVPSSTTASAPGSLVVGPLTSTSDDGAFTLDVPAGVSVPVQPTISRVDASQLPFSTADLPRVVGPAYEVGPNGATFSTPATVRMRLPAQFRKGSFAVLASRTTSGGWDLLADQRVEHAPDGDYLVGTTAHLTLFVALENGGVVLLDRESVSGKPGDKFDVHVNVGLTGDPPWFSIKAVRATPAPGSNLTAHVVHSALNEVPVDGDGSLGVMTIQCDMPGSTQMVVEWVVNISSAWEGDSSVTLSTQYSFSTVISVTCTAPESACAAGPDQDAGFIDFTETLTGIFPDLGDALALCELLYDLGEHDDLFDQFVADAKPPGLASPANDINNSVAFSVREGVNWSDGKKACGTTVSGAYVDCGEQILEDGLIAYFAWVETVAPQPPDGLVSLGVDLILDDDPSNNWPAEPDLPFRVITGADAYITPQALGDGTFAKPVFTDLRVNTGRQSNAMVLIAPSWYGFVTFEPATQVLPWICQFDSVGQGNQHQACDIPGPAATPFTYLTPAELFH